jgi:hypothetical protein
MILSDVFTGGFLRAKPFNELDSVDDMRQENPERGHQPRHGIERK